MRTFIKIGCIAALSTVGSGCELDVVGAHTSALSGDGILSESPGVTEPFDAGADAPPAEGLRPGWGSVVTDEHQVDLSNATVVPCTLELCGHCPRDTRCCPLLRACVPHDCRDCCPY